MANPEPEQRALVFSGHRVDAPERATPRFPAASEQAARRMIREALQAQLAGRETMARGIAGAASGGDILFHEVCDELAIPTEAHLAVPPSDYLEASVADGGAEWIARFAAVTASRPVHVLPLRNGANGDLSVWARGNLAMLDAAAAAAGKNVTLIALWDGEEGDGSGGTADMVKRVRERGGEAVILDAKKLLA
jgi:hypothetical protein